MPNIMTVSLDNAVVYLELPQLLKYLADRVWLCIQNLKVLT